MSTAVDMMDAPKVNSATGVHLPPAPGSPLAETGGSPAGSTAKMLPHSRPSTANPLSKGGATASLSDTLLMPGAARKPPRPRSAGGGPVVRPRPAARPGGDVSHDGGTGSERSAVAQDSARAQFRKCRSNSACSLLSTALPSAATTRPSSRESSKVHQHYSRPCSAGSQGRVADPDLLKTMTRCQTFGEAFHAMSARGGAARRVSTMTFSESRRPQGGGKSTTAPKLAPSASATSIPIRGGGPTLHEAVMAHTLRARRHSYMTFTTHGARDLDPFSKTNAPPLGSRIAKAVAMTKTATAPF